MEINQWLDALIEKLKETFGERLKFVGLQGSYQRGEAHSESDIDVVVILDELKLADLKMYKRVVKEMPFAEKSCGFISGTKELVNWPKAELFQFYYDTQAFYGELKPLLPEIDRTDIITSVKNGAANLYHGACHSFVHGTPADLNGLFKGAFFILQADYFLKNNEYISSKKALFPLLSGIEKDILAASMLATQQKDSLEKEPEHYYELMGKWTSELLVAEY